LSEQRTVTVPHESELTVDESRDPLGGNHASASTFMMMLAVKYSRWTHRQLQEEVRCQHAFRGETGLLTRVTWDDGVDFHFRSHGGRRDMWRGAQTDERSMLLESAKAAVRISCDYACGHTEGLKVGDEGVRKDSEVDREW
jgi:hypothetical protein